MLIHECDQGSAEWYQLRSGIPTASCFSKLIQSDGKPSKSMKTYAVTLAAELYAGEPMEDWGGNYYTDRGKELEPIARSAYEFEKGTEADLVGFITDDLKRYGASPDSLINKEGMLEIKCLKTENHVKTLMYYKKNKRCPTDYVQQTQGQIFIAERVWCDLVFYHPVLPMLTIRQERDRELIKALQNQLALVLEERDRVLNIIKEF